MMRFVTQECDVTHPGERDFRKGYDQRSLGPRRALHYREGKQNDDIAVFKNLARDHSGGTTGIASRRLRGKMMERNRLQGAHASAILWRQLGLCGYH